MSWIADAHRDWHTVHGAPGKSDTVCPLDCWDEPFDPEDYEDPKVLSSLPAVVPPAPLEFFF